MAIFGFCHSGSQLAEPLWTDPGLQSEISVRELISALKKKKKARVGNELSNILPKSSHAKKIPPPLFRFSQREDERTAECVSVCQVYSRRR